MASRPIFLPVVSSDYDLSRPSTLVRRIDVSFTWQPGFSVSQKRKNIRALHSSAMASIPKLARILEVSSKSEDHLGRELSAFHLQVDLGEGRRYFVESMYQGSKVFANGGPYTDLFERSGRDAKRDARLRSSGALKHFRYLDIDWPLESKISFYDWIYIKALGSRVDILEHLKQFQAFSDIEFNPSRSKNSQAHSCALAVALYLIDPGSLQRFLEESLEAVKQSHGGCSARQFNLFDSTNAYWQ